MVYSVLRSLHSHNPTVGRVVNLTYS